MEKKKEEEHEEREPRRSRLLAEGGEAPEGPRGGATAASVSQAQCHLGEEWPMADAVVDWWCSEWEIGLAGHLCPLRAGEGTQRRTVLELGRARPWLAIICIITVITVMNGSPRRCGACQVRCGSPE